MTKLPSLFLSHGAPTFAIEPGRAGPLLTALGERIPRPRAIVVVSAHWMTRGFAISTATQPETIYDFGGFSQELYRLTYPAPGAPAVAEEIIKHLEGKGISVSANAQQGLDHGAWVPLLHLFPKADIPTLQLSLPALRTPKAFVEFGKLLAELREDGILVVGSGSLTHNLSEFRTRSSNEEPYAAEFSAWFAERIAAGDVDALVNYRRQAPHATRAHPTEEHLMPFFVALGAAGDDLGDALRVEGGIANSVLSMDSYVFGVSALTPGAQTNQTTEKDLA